MLTVTQMMNNTRRWARKKPFTNIESNASDVTLYGWDVVQTEDEDGDPYRDVTVKAKSAGKDKKTRFVFLRFYGSGDRAKCAASCDCEWYLYFCEVALDKYSSVYNDPNNWYSNGANPDITNPSKQGIVCKHIFQALSSGAANKQMEEKKKKEKKKEFERKSKEITKPGKPGKAGKPEKPGKPDKKDVEKGKPEKKEPKTYKSIQKPAAPPKPGQRPQKPVKPEK